MEGTASAHELTPVNGTIPSATPTVPAGAPPSHTAMAAPAPKEHGPRAAGTHTTAHTKQLGEQQASKGIKCRSRRRWCIAARAPLRWPGAAATHRATMECINPETAQSRAHPPPCA
jgi:hypothetical protein